MTHSATGPDRMFELARLARTGLGILAQIIAGVMLVILAGVFAIATAFAGVLLAVLAVVMRFAGAKRRQADEPQDQPGVITLNARRTPRGWTVE